MCTFYSSCGFGLGRCFGERKADCWCDRYGHEGVDDNVEFDEDRDNSSDDKDVDVDEI